VDLNKDKSIPGIPVIVMAMMGMLILPIPPMVIDILFTFNIALSIIVLLMAINAKEPLEFSAFPTVLLIATLMRLALNVASTRVVLLNGHTGPDAAGQVIQSFGDVVIGGNYVVGLVVFAILMIINFFVITKGGERISEVSARFTLDALPGKQMAIDADLNAGSLSQDEAKDRRRVIAREADFYGSMDGASKFVKGDAIAGLLILMVNLFGGLMIGVLMHDMSMGESFRIFALLTIGDGLVAQIPSIMLAISAAIMVTRVNDESPIAYQIKTQMLSTPRAIATVAVIMAILGMIPGMPKVAFLGFGAAMGFIAWRISKSNPVIEEDNEEEEVNKFLQNHEGLDWSEITTVVKLGIELGFRLVPLADTTQKSLLPNLIRGTRTTMSEEMGFLIPEVSIKDNVNLKPNEYAIKIDGAVVAKGEAYPNKLFAIETADVENKIEGELVKEPVYGMDAVLIDPDKRSAALNRGYTVADSSAVISTHLNKVARENIDSIFSHDEVVNLKERLKHMSESLAEKLSNKIDDILMLQICRYLLADMVPLRDIKKIATTLVEHADSMGNDPIMLVNQVRVALKRNIVQGVNGDRVEMGVSMLGDNVENAMQSAISQASNQNGKVALDNLHIDPGLLQELQDLLPQVRDDMKRNGYPPILVVLPQLRPQFAKYARRCAKGLSVLSVNEIPEGVDVNVVTKIG